MDDPWGSPWADELHLRSETKRENNATQPATFIRASPLALEENSDSPWGNSGDDGFGDWAALRDDAGECGREDGWERPSAETVALSQDHANVLSTDWDIHSTIEHDGPLDIAPDPLPRPAEPMRRSSPDPWALDIRGKIDQKEASPGAIQDKEEGTSQQTIIDHGVSKACEDGMSTISTDTQLPDTAKDDLISGHSRLKESTDVDQSDKQASVPSSPTGPSLETQESGLVSRPSSLLSERSRHDEHLTDSPRTSFDEDPKPLGNQIPRKASTKIQGLVEHFDGLAKQEVTDPPIRRTNIAQDAVGEESKDEEEDEDELEDFGEFTEGQSGDDEEPREISKGDEGKDQRSQSSGLQHGEPSERASMRIYGPVEFTLDITELENLFSSDVPMPAEGNIFIPDSIPFDSFSSAEERKAWYRVSRYGTMRKHNAGNDENYVRATWKQSKIRDETLKIVSRWMEEDRSSGRVALGGGSRGSSAFGWNDSKSPAVPLAHAFAKNRKQQSVRAPATVEAVADIPREWPRLARDRSTTQSRSASGLRPKSSVKSVPNPNEAKSYPVVPVAPVADFGWNATSENLNLTALEIGSSEPLSNSVSTSKSQSTPHQSRSPHGSSSSTIVSSLVGSNSIPIATASSLDIQRGPPAINKIITTAGPVNVINDDDDWGEMISSPDNPSVPAFPPQRGLRHSFGGLDGDVAQISNVSERPVDILQSNPNRRTSTRFDEPLVPQILPSPLTGHRTSSEANAVTAAPGNIFSTPIRSMPVVEASVDPWASADLSFFDTPAPAQKPMPPATAKATVLKAVKSNPSPMSLGSDQMPREETEQDRIARAVVRGLPDLSYMLRK
ncbi:hypothetical protein LZ554_008732 [Drepanopeziza brunnea f. sp. 'monogermtubi']|nr:hypothetical protein LZ554_008732 [Drepanopeziza brunnea f. sp. 'monogermtubi']